MRDGGASGQVLGRAAWSHTRHPAGPCLLPSSSSAPITLASVPADVNGAVAFNASDFSAENGEVGLPPRASPVSRRGVSSVSLHQEEVGCGHSVQGGAVPADLSPARGTLGPSTLYIVHCFRLQLPALDGIFCRERELKRAVPMCKKMSSAGVQRQAEQ